MGNSQANVVLQVVGNPKAPDVWKISENISHCDIVTNMQTGEVAESYTVPLNGRIKLEEEFRKYEYRRTQNQNLVKVYQVVKKNSEYLCSGMDFINVKTERIPYRLNEIRQLSLPEAVYVLNATLIGYKRIKELIGPVKIDANMIGITPNGEIRVWLNENLAKNHPELQYEFDPQMPDEQAQKQMIQYLIQTIKGQLQGQQFPPEIGQRLTPDKIRSFDTALHLTRDLGQSLGLNLTKMRINYNAATVQSVTQSTVSNVRQTLPPMPMQVSNIKQSHLSQQSLNPVIAAELTQIIPGQSQIMNQSIMQSQIIQPHQSLQQSQINQLNNSTVQLVRKSSGSLRGSGVNDPLSQFAEPIQIIISGAPEMSHIASGSIVQVNPMVVDHSSSIFPAGQISQGSQILQTSQVIQQIPQQVISQASQVFVNSPSYQQPSIPPLVKGKPPRPISASKTFAPPEVVSYQIAEGINELRRSRSRQLRRSASRESIETATFVAPQVIQGIVPQVVQPVAVKVNPSQGGVRAPSPLRSLSGSRVVVGAKVVGPPVSLQSINSSQATSATQIIQDLPRVIKYAPGPVVEQRLPINYQERVQVAERVIVGDQRQYVQERVPIQRVQRIPMINQPTQQRIAVKRSIQKINAGMNAPLTVVNTNNGAPVIHLMRHHNRQQQQMYDIPKPMTGGSVSQGITALNQRYAQHRQ